MDKYQQILRQYWGYDDFRGIQRDIIESIGRGEDTLGLMPTGGGKSITFQVPALAMEGLCIVITPLISLMKDQVDALKRHGIRAAFVNSTLRHDKLITVLENCIFGAYKFLYISPERIASPIFQEKLRRMKVCFITVDEAHCICQWGYDFRPSYLQIATLRDLLPGCPVLALTATATPEVVLDIQHNLRFQRENVRQMSFLRSNLAYCVIDEDEKLSGALRVLNGVPGSCIIYCRNRDHCREMAEHLTELGYTATYYHAGLKAEVKEERQELWRRGEVRIMVATNAFGMGIDKPDVRLVIHVDMPDSIEEYFQEAGRAGRDGERAYAVFVYTPETGINYKRRLGQQFPDMALIRDIYELLCCFHGIAIGDGLDVTREMDLGRFCVTYRYFPTQVLSVLELLTLGGYIDYQDEDEPFSLLHILVSRSELFRATDAQGEAVMLSMLRHFGGLFVDYTVVGEDLVCKDTGLSMNEVYQTLVQLTKQHLVSYIPRKRMPRITFLQRRVEKEEIHLSRDVYEGRRERYAKRLDAMHGYLRNTDTCRSRLLLRYFGEESKCDCGMCDNCIALRKGAAKNDDPRERIRTAILRQLENGPMSISCLHAGEFDPGLLGEVLEWMVAREEVRIEDGVVSSPTAPQPPSNSPPKGGGLITGNKL